MTTPIQRVCVHCGSGNGVPKSAMAQTADVFVALPGGLGTMQGLFEVLTWAQIGLHGRPIGLLNVRSYFDPLLSLIDRARQHGYLHNTDRVRLIAQADPDSLLDRLIGGRSV